MKVKSLSHTNGAGFYHYYTPYLRKVHTKICVFPKFYMTLPSPISLVFLDAQRPIC